MDARSAIAGSLLSVRWRSLLVSLVLLVIPALIRAQTPAPTLAPVLPPTPTPVVSTLADFWTVTARDLVRPVHMEVLVNYYDPVWKHMWCEVEGATGYMPCKDLLPLETGDRVLVEGTFVARTGFSNKDVKITVLQHHAPRVPVHATGRLNDYMQLRSHLVTCELTFDSEKIPDGTHLEAQFVAEGRRVHVYVWSKNPQLLRFRQGSTVRVTGVYNANADPQTSMLEIDLWVASNDDIILIEKPETDPRFDAPIVPIGDVKIRYLEGNRRVHTAGVVRQYEPGQSLIIRDITGQVIVQTLQTLPLRIGDWVEVSGDPYAGGSDWLIRRGIVRLPGKEALAAQEKQRLAPAETSLRLVDEILELSAKEAARNLPVDISGVVIWANPHADFLFLRDTSGSVAVKVAPGDGKYPEVNEAIRVVGVTAPGSFAPEIRATSHETWGTALPPEAKLITFDQAVSGLLEGQRVEISGHVQGVSQEGAWTWLTLSTPTGTFRYGLMRDDSLTDLLGSIVAVKGICHALANDRRQLTGIEVLGTNRDQIRVQQASLVDPFALPLRDIGSLRQFHPSTALNYWASIEGTVTLQEPGHFIFIQDQSEGVMLLSGQSEQLQPGDEIRATGLPGWENGRVVLREVVFKKTGHRHYVAPAVIHEPMTLHDDLDSLLVTVRGTLISSALNSEGLVLSLQEGHQVFSTILSSHGTSVKGATWNPGSKLELTGVYQLVRDERRQAGGFRLGLRSLSDVKVLQNPSWWTPARAFGVTGSLVAILAVGFTWVAVLRRRVTRQTDQIRAQVAKEGKLQAHQRAIVANANDFIFTTDMEGRFTTFNPAGEKLLGYPSGEALKMNLRDLVPVEETAQRESIRGTLSKLSQSAARFELKLVNKAGVRIWTEVSACLVQNAGEALGVLGVVRDISERKQIEEELKRARDAAQATTEAKSAFLANMSHEIRTPMNGVIGMGNLLLDTPLSEEQREYAETIRNSAESLLTVLNDILDFSKIEAGKLHFEVQDFDLMTSVEETLELLSMRAASKKIELTLFIPPDLPRYLRGDPGRLRQVLINLVGNAVKFTDQGEVAIALSLAASKEDEIEIRFEVRDTGLGIAEPDIGRLFQPFSQADASTTRRFGGTGLGLAISRQIVELMHGYIGVKSEIGTGSTFWFTAKFSPSTNKATSKKLSPAPLDGVRLLSVDDHATNCRIVSAYTTAWGMRSESVATADEAMVTLRQAAEANDPFRVVLLDYQMPEKDGLTLAREIRADANLASLALIFLTSVDRRFTREETQALRLSAVITKPIHTDELQLAVGKAISGMSDVPTARASDTITLRSPSMATPERALRVLVAEDNTVNQRLVVLQLQKLGYRADVAANGIEVLSALERGRYDVILMDCQMPEMDGYEASSTIRKDERFSEVKIIAMTANAMQGDREKCIEAGMNDYLTKPTRLDELQAALKRV